MWLKRHTIETRIPTAFDWIKALRVSNVVALDARRNLRSTDQSDQDESDALFPRLGDFERVPCGATPRRTCLITTKAALLQSASFASNSVSGSDITIRLQEFSNTHDEVLVILLQEKGVAVFEPGRKPTRIIPDDYSRFQDQTGNDDHSDQRLSAWKRVLSGATKNDQKNSNSFADYLRTAIG